MEETLDQKAELLSVRNLERVAQSFGLFTAASFLVSVLINSLWMQVTLGLSYLRLATPADVLLNGIQAVGAAVVTVALNSLVLLSFPKRSRRKMLARLTVRHWVSLAVNRTKGSTRNTSNNWYDALQLTFLVLPLCLLVWLSMSADENLYYVSGADLPHECDLAPVVWMGSQSVVIRCSARSHVVRDSENVSYAQGDTTCVPAGRSKLCENHAPGTRSDISDLPGARLATR